MVYYNGEVVGGVEYIFVYGSLFNGIINIRFVKVIVEGDLWSGIG